MAEPADLISSYSLPAVREYLDARRFPGRWATKWKIIPRADALADVELPVEVEHIKWNVVKKVWRGVTRGLRINAAAWRWIQPESPTVRLSEVRRLKKAVGLDDIEDREFVERSEEH